MAAATKKDRRELARGIRHQMSVYLDLMTPALEDYAARGGTSLEERRELRIEIAGAMLRQLAELEARR